MCFLWVVRAFYWVVRKKCTFRLQIHFRLQTQYHTNTTGKMLIAYTRLRDGIYLVSVILCLLSFLLNLNDNTVGTGRSLQKVFVSHYEDHTQHETLLILFSCATTLGFSFLPNLIIETLQTKTTEEAIDAFLLERYLFILSFTTPSLVGLCGVFSEYEHTASLFIAATSISWITYSYITALVLERSTYTKIWTRKLILGLFLLSCILFSVVFQISENLRMKWILALFKAVVILYYFINYLIKVDIKEIIWGRNRAGWKESMVIFTCIGSVIFIILQIIKILVFGNFRHNATIYTIKIHVIIKMCIFMMLANIFNTVPRTNLAVSKATSTSLKEFVRNMCHEIRTPLSVARMGLSTIQDMILLFKDVLKIPDYLKIIELLDESLEGTDIAVEVLNEALQMDKIESGLFTCDKVHKNLGSFIRKTVNIFHGKCVSKNITFDYDIWKEHKILRTIVNIDEAKMAQVLRNFLSNALKFTPACGTITVNAHTFYKEDSNPDNKVHPLEIEMGVEYDNFVRVEVVDTGIGISEENIDKLFKSGIQIDAHRNQEGGGSGFGLLIAKKVVEMHDGNIGVMSQGLDQGSCFYFEIPIVEISRETPPDISYSNTPLVLNRKNLNRISEQETRSVEFAQQEASKIVELTEKNELSKPLVLVVEDNKVCSKLLSRTLREYNVDADCVYDGKEALDTIKEDISKYAMIFMDNRMPVMNGMDATEKLRQLGYKNPIVGFTGDVMEEDMKKFIEKGANFVLGKPVKNEDLQEVLIRYNIIPDDNVDSFQ